MDNQQPNMNTNNQGSMDNDVIDIREMLYSLVKSWKLILIISFIGMSASAGVAFSIQKQYLSVARVKMPSRLEIERFNLATFVEYSNVGLFQQYYELLRTERNMISFISKNEILNNWSHEQPSGESITLNRLLDNIEITVLESIYENGIEIAVAPKLIELVLISNNEPKATEFVNEYIEYTNKEMHETLLASMKIAKESRIANIQRRMKLLKESARIDRERQIERIVYENSLKIDLLSQERDLLVKLTQMNRLTQLANVREAKKIATKLSIEEPTPIDELNDKLAPQSVTKINLSGSSQELPLYLMGIKYLNAVEESLMGREDDSIFLTRINEISSEISKINEDPTLLRLQNRKDDTPFIDTYPALVMEIETLNSYDLDIADINFYDLVQSAKVTGKVFKPNRFQIILIGALLSFILAVFVSLLFRRDTVLHENEPS
ncbi:MAG: Wzz/FepE/Etk N-terminal domain-containing protein [Aestuariibacter sp.]